MVFKSGDRVALRNQKSFDGGAVILPADSKGTIEISGPTISGVDFDDDTGSVHYRVVENADLRTESD